MRIAYYGIKISPYGGPSVRYDYILLGYRIVENSGYRNPFHLTNHPVEIQKSLASVFLNNIVLLFILTLSRQGCVMISARGCRWLPLDSYMTLLILQYDCNVGVLTGSIRISTASILGKRLLW